MDRRPEDAIVREQLGSLTEPERDALSAQLAAENSDPALIRLWRYLARPAQLAPPGNWRLWLVMAGRGFGKTRAGAEWVRALARRNRFARIALVGASLAEARAVMVEGESGLLNLGPPEQRPVFEPSTRRLRWPNGALGLLYSAAEPESLRGPQHSHACWAGPERSDDQRSLRLGRCPGSTARKRYSRHPARFACRWRVLDNCGRAERCVDRPCSVARDLSGRCMDFLLRVRRPQCVRYGCRRSQDLSRRRVANRPAPEQCDGRRRGRSAGA